MGSGMTGPVTTMFPMLSVELRRYNNKIKTIHFLGTVILFLICLRNGGRFDHRISLSEISRNFRPVCEGVGGTTVYRGTNIRLIGRRDIAY